MQGLIGKKLGMTQVYDAQGRRMDVTVLEAGPCVVTQCKTAEKDGYAAVQLGFGEQKESRVPKGNVGHFKKAGTTPKRVVREVGLDAGEAVKVGDTVTAAIFSDVSHVDIAGVTKGRGFQGVVRRHKMGGGPSTHGHTSHRRIGAIGMRTLPGRVLEGHRMPGHMGHVHRTIQNIAIVRVDAERNLLLVNGSVPGPVGSVVMIHRALKKQVGKAK
ncbi:MAG: 50S ribosomal protein L3 [Verrucomicrobia bacterium]|nr:50S ribosomal protein L3 [Verrucomicrobiota bacterium]